MTTRLKIICGDSKENFIIDTELLNKYAEDLSRERHWTDRIITWSSIFAIFQWIEEQGIEVNRDKFYIPGRKLTITQGNF